MKLITPVFKGSFVHLVEPKAPAPEADPVYSMSIVLPKDEPETKAFMKKLQGACSKAIKDRFGDKAKKWKKPWKDGDEEEREEWANCWIISAKSKSRPGVVMSDLKPVMDEELLYSGAFYRASISEWTWSHPTGGKGASLNLDNVMWVRDGDRFDSRTAAEDDFADFQEASANDDDVDDDEVNFG